MLRKSASGSQVVAINAPNFCGTVLEGSTVIYLLDRGGAMQDYLGELKDATIKSLGTLGSSRKFQIVFWSNGTDAAYPENTTTYANQDSITAAQKSIDDVSPSGQTDIQRRAETSDERASRCIGDRHRQRVGVRQRLVRQRDGCPRILTGKNPHFQPGFQRRKPPVKKTRQRHRR